MRQSPQNISNVFTKYFLKILNKEVVVGRLLGRLLGVTLCCVVTLHLIPENGWAMRNGRTDASSEFEFTLGSGSPSSHSTSVIIPKEEHSGVSSHGGSSTSPLLEGTPPPKRNPRMGVSSVSGNSKHTEVSIDSAEKEWPKWVAENYDLINYKDLSGAMYGVLSITPAQNSDITPFCQGLKKEQFEQKLFTHLLEAHHVPPTFSSRVWGFFTSTPLKMVYGGLLASGALAAVLYFGGPEIMCLLPFDALQDFCARVANSSAASEQLDQLREQVQKLNTTYQEENSKLTASLTHLPELLESAKEWVDWAYQGGFLPRETYQEQREWLEKMFA